MKTTFDIPEPLLRKVQRLAKESGTTTKSLVEQALIRLLEERDVRVPYQLADMSVDGDGLCPEFTAASWGDIRDTLYGVDR